jgi:hypothetical protein
MTAGPFVVTEPGIYDGIPDDVYHGDPVPEGSLSNSGAKLLLPPNCPAVFHAERGIQVIKDTFDFGHAAHQKVLGVGPEIAVIDHEVWNTKVAKEEVAAAREAGLVPLKRAAYDQVESMAAAILAHPFAAQLFSAGKAEQSAFWRDERTGIWLRARFDWLPDPVDGRRMIIPDYKTAVSAEPDKWSKAAADHGYHMQDAHYTEAAVALGLDDDPAFVFVVQEKRPPYVVTVIELDPDAKRLGAVQNRRARDIYKRCTDTGHWPGYADDEVVQVALPAWFMQSSEHPFIRLAGASA